MIAQETTTTQRWYGCYDGGWKGTISDSAMAHPAKFANGLVRRIFEYALEKGYFKPGYVVIDPFGGVGLGGLYAAESGIFWLGCELERDFTILGHQNFTEFCKRWCTCGDYGQSYLYSMREAFQEKLGRSEPQKEAEDGTVLQQGLQEQLPLFGEEVESGTARKTQGSDTLESGQKNVTGNQRENINESERESRGSELELERGEARQGGRIHRDSGEWFGQDGAHPLDGVELGQEDEKGGGGASQERQQTRQPAREPGSNDHLRAYEATPPERGDTPDDSEDLRNLREDIPGQASPSYLQRALQAAEESRVLAQTRRQTEGKFCKTCGKIIVPFPVLLNGDSRQLRWVIGQAVMDGVLSSPPYANGEKGHPSLGSVNKDNWGRDGRDIAARRGVDGNYGQSSGQLANLKEGDLDGVISSPPFPDGGAGDGRPNGGMKVEPAKKGNYLGGLTNYGTTPGQLANLKEGDLDALLTSPPFAGNTGGRGEASRNGIDAALFDRHSGGMKRGTGDNPANLDHLPMKGFGDAVLTSPPFEESLHADDRKTRGNLYNGMDKNGKPRGGKFGEVTYGTTAGQLGTMTGGFSKALELAGLSEAEQDKTLKDAQEERGLWREQPTTFWQAARTIVAESYMALKPGAYTFWVVKRFVRDGAIVDFTGQWRQLCEACGFEFVEHIEAMLIQSESEQGDLNGGTVKHKKKKASFFRRLHEKKFPHLAIDCEDVLVMRKPQG